MAEHGDLTSIHRFAYVTATDPGAVGARKGWVDTSGPEPYPLKVRNSTNDDWEQVGASGTGVTRGLLADRPAFGHSGDIYVSTDTGTLYYDTGTGWEEIFTNPEAGNLVAALNGVLSAGTNVTINYNEDLGYFEVNAFMGVLPSDNFLGETQPSRLELDSEFAISQPVNVTRTRISLDYRRTATIWGHELIPTSGGTYQLLPSPQAANPYGVVCTPIGVADGDEFEADFLCHPGDYVVTVIGSKDDDQGILELYMDGALIDTLDWYASSPTHNFQWEVQLALAASATTSTRHLLGLRVNGKNGSSSGYSFGLAVITITPSLVPDGAVVYNGDLLVYNGDVVVYGG